MREVLFVAGEASGDMHAGSVAARLREIRPDLATAGVGGAHMRASGVEITRDYAELAVMGFVEVVRHIPKHAALLRQLRARLATGNVAVVVLIDYPGFNMKVAAAAREAGVPVLYYVTPQVWAWGAGRLPKLARLVTKAAVILPFEAPLLAGYGIDTTFVGHPLLDRAQNLPTRAQARERLGIGPDEKVLALFPGSREQEIARHFLPFIESGRELARRHPGLRVIVHGAPTVNLDALQCPFEIVRGASFDVFRAADVALCKSGTTTLEAAIAQCPMAVAYRTGGLSYAIARRVVKIPYIGLVNVVAGREVAREFVQGALQPVAVATELGRLLDDAAYREAQREGLIEVRNQLGTPGAAGRVAEMISGLAG
ncbi:MAG TPA: lipid-A-disaccharide synthase [Gemmatimonadaceae bacterium]|nr:lipid-A-disaccharide synthase [Gemmatimonadaceae bacterium]